ncbi:unnamed protein product [Owenia fusiformis]|uniref:Uncharacterized protein n=1 Tax=Owenia fusiformis TaxID=6347 RepID=A0A8S4NYV4_OWEFU|nr:unnamed protein product [Owenia fusiformis]
MADDGFYGNQSKLQRCLLLLCMVTTCRITMTGKISSSAHISAINSVVRPFPYGLKNSRKFKVSSHLYMIILQTERNKQFLHGFTHDYQGNLTLSCLPET